MLSELWYIGLPQYLKNAGNYWALLLSKHFFGGISRPRQISLHLRSIVKSLSDKRLTIYHHTGEI